MLGSILNLKPRKFIHNIGDAHIYINHIEQVKEQLSRTPHPFPSLKITPKYNIDDFKLEDFVILDYTSCAFIKADLAI
jgi:thymidylate synthase